MADQPDAATSKDSVNPYAAPTAKVGDPWSKGDPAALELRRAHRRDDAYMKALVITNLIYALIFGAGAVAETSNLISHLAGGPNHPGLLPAGRFTGYVVSCFMPVAALGAAWGFFRRKRWALRFELALLACWFVLWAIEPLTRTSLGRGLQFIALTAIHLALAAPMLDAWRVRRSVVFEPEYAEAIAATRHLRVWPRLSLRATLITVALFVLATVLVGLAGPS